MGRDREPATTPICRCRVMYLGSSVPHVTKDGLQGIQEPLRDLYPENGILTRENSGIDSWLSVWSNGILVENVDDSGREVKRFFPIESLHYCAAVRFVVVPAANSHEKPGERVAKFLPLDSPFSRHADTTHPPLFACILRRTTGIKVLECHAFVCKREPAANALVRCCFHAYADSMHAKQMDENPYSQINGHAQSSSQINGHGRRSRSISALDSVEKVEAWRHRSTEALADPNHDSDTPNGNGLRSRTPSEAGASSHSKTSHSPGDDNNYKVWNGGPRIVERQMMYPDGGATLRSVRSAAVNSVVSMRPRTRQMLLGPGMPPPPPPFLAVPTLKKDKGLKNSLRKLKKKHKNGTLLAPMHPGMGMGPPPPHVLAANGYVMMPVPPPHAHSGIPYHGPPPPHPMYGPPPGSVFGEPRRLRRGVDGPPPMAAYGDEGVYMPQMRPVTPLSTYQGQSYHHEQPHYVQYPGQTFGTGQRSTKEKKKKSRKGDQGNDSDSPFNTGIYKKKGHLNERAFSYSIRQEHRSRSNSLANIEVNPDDTVNGIEEPQHHERLSNGHHHVNGDVINGKLAHSFESLHINGHGPPPMENGHSSKMNGALPKTASIKRGSQNGLSKMVPAAPPPLPMGLNGNVMSDKSNGKHSKQKASPVAKQRSK